MKHLFFIFYLFIISNTFSQTFTISGIIQVSNPKQPVDTSVAVKILSETGRIYQTYCDTEGKYKFILPDSLDGKRLLIEFFQDETRLTPVHSTCSCTDCYLGNLYFYSLYQEKVKIHLDSIKDYVFNFAATLKPNHFSFPTIYFRKNELTTINIDPEQTLPIDELICFLFDILQCRHKQIVMEINGSCSPKEKDKDNLSLKRAQLIKDKLVACGINPVRLVVKGNADKRFWEIKDANGTV